MTKTTYTEMVDSGIEWIGKIPKGWEVRKIARSFDVIGSGTTPESGNPNYYDNGDINRVNTGDLNDGIINECPKTITNKAFEKYSVLKLFPKGTLLIALYGATIGKIGLLNIEACTNQACSAIFGSKFFDQKYIFYWFLANKQEIINLGYGGGQPNISQDIIRNIRLPRPPLTTQQTIASYLDTKIVQIDEAISLKTQQISLLREKRTALINHVVTKGLEPDVELVESSIEWIGKMPKGWEVTKIKNISSKITQGPNPDYNIGEPVSLFRVLKTKDIYDNYINYDCDDISEETFLGCKSGEALDGDLFITIVGHGSIGKVAVYKKKNENRYLYTRAIALIRFKNTNPEYYAYFFMSDLGKNIINNIIDGSTGQEVVKTSSIKNLNITIPSLEEQQAIASYLDTKTAEIHQTVTLVQQSIDLLVEYKQSLISHVVTGKVKVG